jgi:hypothetical protein
MLCAMVLATGAFLGLVPASQADTSDPVWTCRASLGYLFAPGQDPPNRLEPVVANGGTSTDPNNIERPQCVDDEAGFPEIEIGGGPDDPGRLAIQAPFARTQIEPNLGPARDQNVSAAGGAAKVSLSDADGSFTLTADVTDANGTASCVNGVPTLAATSRVVNLAINGMPLPLEDALIPIIDGINGSPLVMLLRIDIHEETKSGNATSDQQSLIHRALHVQLLQTDPAEPPALEAVLGEVRLGRNGAVCAPPEPPPTCPEGFTEVGRQADGSVTCQQVVQTTAPCPQGTTQDASGACVRVVVVNAPPEVVPPCPGAQVRDITGVCRDEPASRCVAARFGTPFLGTNGADRITGSNRADRILSLGGRDRVSGGRGNDCLEGGSGNDNLDGSNNNDLMFGDTGRDIMNGGTGRDRLVGDSGNDKLSGSSGNDRLEGSAGRDKLSGGLGRDVLIGGAGRDYIEGGPGGDTVRAGTGHDVINVSESGAGRDIVDCGSGTDVVRVDSRDRVRANCERVLITIRRR